MSLPVSVRVRLHCMMSTKGYCLDHHEYNVGQWLNGYDTWDWSVSESMERYELNELQCLVCGWIAPCIIGSQVL